MKPYSRVFATVDLDAVRQNMEAMRDHLNEGTGMIGVVKADGYGHGSVPVALAVAPYVWGYAVATVEEAVLLRNHNIVKPILILGVTPRESYRDLVRYDIRPAIFQYEKAAYLSELAVSQGKTAFIHIAVDTGMSRIGYEVCSRSAEEVTRISQLPGISIEGLFTHFSRADEVDKKTADIQIELYRKFVKLLQALGVKIPILHCSNSAGILELRRADFHMVRAGISIYGLYPSGEMGKAAVSLTPALSLKSIITYVKTIKAGTSVSYGGTFTADHSMTIATIPVGYGDGYPRNLSNKGEVLIRGRRAGILGRVCMDQLMVDVSGIPDAAEDDEVTLIGRDGTEQITVEELAERGGGFHYEILCDIGKRVPRVYMEHGCIVGRKDYFNDRYEGFEASI